MNQTEAQDFAPQSQLQKLADAWEELAEDAHRRFLEARKDRELDWVQEQFAVRNDVYRTCAAQLRSALLSPQHAAEIIVANMDRARRERELITAYMIRIAEDIDALSPGNPEFWAETAKLEPWRISSNSLRVAADKIGACEHLKGAPQWPDADPATNKSNG